MKPTVVVNPETDEVFAAFAEMLVEHGAGSAAELERRLRAEYSRATVHSRLLSGEPRTIWYVYRDGHWVNARRAAEQRVGGATSG